MKLLLLITDLQAGGSPTVVRELAIRLRRVGTDVEVACLSKWGPVADQLRDAGVAVTPFNAQGARDVLILPKLIRFIRTGNFQTVLSFLMHANAMAAAASLRVRDVRWIQSIQTTQPWPAWHWVVQRLAHRAADTIIVPSQSVADAAATWSAIPTEKIIVIPNAVDLADWAEVQANIPTANPRPYPITFLGRLDLVKDVPTLVRAVAQLNGLVHFDIHGEGSDRDRIESEIRTTRAPVTLHGMSSSPQAALAHSGLLVLPSLAEGFGLVLIEAMVAGVPVVATNVPGIRDVVRNEETGLLVAPGDADALANAIRRIVEDPALRQRLIEQGQTEVRQRFTWDAVLVEYCKVLNLQPPSTDQTPTQV